MTTANKLSCGMSNASILLCAINDSTFTISKKHEKSCKILRIASFHDFFGRDFFGAATVEFSFACFTCTTSNSNEHHTHGLMVYFYQFIVCSLRICPFEALFFPFFNTIKLAFLTQRSSAALGLF